MSHAPSAVTDTARLGLQGESGSQFHLLLEELAVTLHSASGALQNQFLWSGESAPLKNEVNAG